MRGSRCRPGWRAEDQAGWSSCRIRLLLVAFELLAHKADTLGIPLEPMTFLASPGIASFEHWDETAVMLRSLDDR